MQLVEQHVISKDDPRYEAIDRASFASKNLYNAANYLVRQAFIFQGTYMGEASVFHLIKGHEAYQALPRKVSNDVLRLLDKNWKSFFKAVRAWKAHPEQFLGRPKLPGYKDKTEGRNILIYDLQALSKKGLKRGLIQPSQLGITIPTKQQNVKQVRITPKSNHYVVEVVYEQEPEPASVDASLVAGIDLGLDNLATLTSNKPGFVPRLVSGKLLKSINQGYNKRRAELQSQLKGRFTSKQLEQLTDKRNRRIKHLLHSASKSIVALLVAEGIGTLVIGHNPEWKQDINIGKRNNQNFVQIPHARFIDMLTYKCQLVGIQVIVTEESYTSKCSFLDMEPIGKHEQYMGKRVKRGLFRSADGHCYHADVNGSYNIIRKVVPDAFSKGIEGTAVHPCRLAIAV
jgi:putative transposase